MFNSGKTTFFLKLVFSFGLLGWFLWKTDLTQVLKVLSAIPLLTFLLVTGIYFFALFINTLKWKLLLQNYAMSQLFSFTLIAQYYSLILPGQLAGEAVKAYKLGKGNKDAEQIAASVVIDRITGLLGLIIVALIGLLCSKAILAKESMPWFILCFAICVVCLCSFYFQSFEHSIRGILLFVRNRFCKIEKIINQCLRLIDAWVQYLGTPVILVKSILLGIVFQLIAVFITMTLAGALGININFADWCWIFGVISLVVFLPITIGGIGLREGGFVILLGQLGVPGEKALALSLSIFGLQIIGAIAGGVVEFWPNVKK
jgi:uncharacterized protein (TIRG00374 family)